jgi:hypothetical protein
VRSCIYCYTLQNTAKQSFQGIASENAAIAAALVEEAARKAQGIAADSSSGSIAVLSQQQLQQQLQQ